MDGVSCVLNEIADGVLIRRSTFCTTNTVIVGGPRGVLLVARCVAAAARVLSDSHRKAKRLAPGAPIVLLGQVTPMPLNADRIRGRAHRFASSSTGPTRPVTPRC